MKSKLFSFTAALFTIALIASCAKLDKVLVKKDGIWNITRTYIKVTIGGTTFLEVTDNAPDSKVTFMDDGTGFNTDSSGTKTYFTWTADDKEATITITDTSGGTTTVMTMDVTNEEKNSMTIKGMDTDTTGGVTTVTTIEQDLARPE